MKSTPLSASVSRKGEDCYAVYISGGVLCFWLMTSDGGFYLEKYACNVISVLALDNEPVTPNSTRISVPRILQLLNVIVLVCT